MTDRLTALLVDDEAPARERLATLLAAHPEVEIVGQAEDVEDAAELCARLRPAVVLLDVQLRLGLGFDLLPLLGYAPAVIVVSSHDRWAPRAAEAHAVDFLLKPVHPDRLTAALLRAHAGLAPASSLPVPASSPGAGAGRSQDVSSPKTHDREERER